MIYGYTCGVYDIYHPEHAIVLERARSRCDHLTVGLTTDEAATYKGTRPLFSYRERYEILRSVRWVDSIVPQEDLDKFEAWKRLKYDVLFVGGWYGDENWQRYEAELDKVGVRTVYFPRGTSISTTELRQRLA